MRAVAVVDLQELVAPEHFSEPGRLNAGDVVQLEDQLYIVVETGHLGAYGIGGIDGQYRFLPHETPLAPASYALEKPRTAIWLHDLARRHARGAKCSR